MPSTVRRRRLDAVDAILYVALALVALACLYPFVYVIAASFSSPSSVLAGDVTLWPIHPTFEGYRIILHYDQFWIAYRNTVLYTVGGTLLNVTLTVMAAYPLSRRWFYGRNVIQLIAVFTLFFNGGLIPTFLLVRNLHLLDTPWVMILPGAVNAFNLVIARTYFETNLPDELLEAAELDGASDLRVLCQVVVPLSRPLIAVLSLFYAVAHWNEYFNALIYLHSRNLLPLQVVLREIVVSQSMQQVMGDYIGMRAEVSAIVKFATIVVATVPILMVYPFVQRHFVKGALLGALKS
jgi:putative aldouronate transport system permease protein